MDPDWYAGWREEAFEQLNAKNERLHKDFRLGNWSRYNYDLKAGKLLFSEAGVVKVVAEIQICLLYTSPSPRDRQKSRMPSSA